MKKVIETFFSCPYLVSLTIFHGNYNSSEKQLDPSDLMRRSSLNPKSYWTRLMLPTLRFFGSMRLTSPSSIVTIGQSPRNQAITTM